MCIALNLDIALAKKKKSAFYIPNRRNKGKPTPRNSNLLPSKIKSRQPYRTGGRI